MVEKKTVKLILKQKIKETSDIFSFVCTRPEDLEWIAGYHGIFRIPGFECEGEKNFRIFSIASVPEENIVLFSTRIVDDCSQFKKRLLELEVGDEIELESPQGRFLIDNFDRPICVIAGGIGITPVRAFLEQLDYANKDPKEMVVLYSDDRGEFAYEDTLKQIEKKHRGLEVVFINDRNVFVVKIEEFAMRDGNDALYYIAGTPGMNAFITEKLVGLGINKENIKTDNFMGY